MESLISLCVGFILLCVIVPYTTAQGACLCQAIDDNARDTVYTNFGAIHTCADLGFCACEAAGITACRRACQKIVENWARFNCPAKLRQREVRARYAAGECKNGLGDNTHNCRAQQIGGFMFGIAGAAGAGGAAAGNNGNAGGGNNGNGPLGGCCSCNAWILDQL